MFDSLKTFTDRVLGRGSAAITVPVMDGTLKPNRLLEEAEVVAELPGIDDLAGDDRALWASAGPALHRIEDSGAVEQRRFDAPISALALSPGGRLAVALDGRRIEVFDAAGATVGRLDALAGQPMVCVNALAWQDDETLLFSDGSREHGSARWAHDLMTLGRSGRAARWRVPGPQAELLADGLAHAFGVLPEAGGGVLIAESWRHRVLRRDAQGRSAPLLAELPGYPSRMAPASGSGFWLSCFVCRTQLVEFVLREPAYRKRMVAEIDPRHWIAPALSSGHSFLEPLQGAGVKNMGVLKPWAPPRSYGLVLRVSADGRALRSLHSQVDGQHHGITAIREYRGALYAASKGRGRLLRVALNGDEE